MSFQRTDGLVTLGKRTDRDAEPASSEPAATAHGPRVYVETYGCQMNVADTDMVTGLLTGSGYRTATSADDADVILINTCAVREKAEERVYNRARELAAHKKRRADVRLGIIGCMAEHLKASIFERAPYVDILGGPDSYRRLDAMITEARNRPADAGDPLVDVKLDKRETYEGLSGVAGGDGVSGFVTIQRGCDKCCTFCVVPLTRGRERGVAPREVLRQVRAYADAGYREVVLLGQTVNSYAWEDVTFAGLLRAVAQVDGIERIRFTSPYPVDFTADVIDVIANEPKVCQFVHLPLQSGSDAVLERMRRNYTVADFRAIVRDLRAAAPDVAMSSDILSGFCGETEEDHQQTLQLMEEVRFDSAFMFMYSERSGTFAARKLPDDVTEPVKKRRLREIIELQERISREAHQARVGKTERVLLHQPSKRNPDQLVGRTDGFKAVIVPRTTDEGVELAPGQFVDVVIERATMATLFGKVTAVR